MTILFLLGSLHNHTLAYNQAAMSVKELYPYSDKAVFAGVMFLGLVNTAFVFAGLKFMWDVRHPKKE